MSTTPHPRAQLSAYLDGALLPAQREAVDAHLAACDDCRARLGELRATTRLIASLPSPAPSRRLVPRIAAVPAWLAPLRTLSTLASGLAVFLFIASALLANIGPLATSSATSASQLPLLVPAGGAAAPAPSTAFRNASGVASPPAPAAAQDAAKSAASPSANVALQPTAAPASAEEHTVTGASQATGTVSYSPFGSPWLWLVIALVTGAIAIALQRRLRSV
ncbi:MAG TPA: anti-sigma factor [Candidatus Acidoferrales bacterium]|nr:anti-sigma factor [Candidatus Acidoferrales bacterium]